MTKQCRICGNDFEIKNKRAHCRQYCYSCVPDNISIRDKTSARRRAIKTDIIKILGGACMKCGETRHYILDFHHTNPEEKDYALSSNLYRPHQIYKELHKCILLCSNCHREYHHLYRETQLPINEYVNLTNFNPTIPIINRAYQYTPRPIIPRTKLENDKFIYHCVKCGEEITRKNLLPRNATGLCTHCKIRPRKCEHPTKETLENELTQNTFRAVGDKYGVSDNAVRKWCKAYGLPTHSSDYRKIQQENQT